MKGAIGIVLTIAIGVGVRLAVRELMRQSPPPPSTHQAASPESDLKHLESKCAAGDGRACNALGERYGRAKGAPLSPDRAIANFKRGCELQDVTACSNLGALMGAGRGMPKDVARSIELLKRGCSGDVPFACGALGRLLVQEYQRSREEEAVAAFRRGCTLDHQMSCTDLATVWNYPHVASPHPDAAAD
jgi:TPR repeat protein